MRLNVLLCDYVCGICYGPLMDIGGEATCRNYPDDHDGAHFILSTTAKRETERAQDNGNLFLMALLDGNRGLAIECGLAEPLKQGAELQKSFEHNRRALRGDDSLF